MNDLLSSVELSSGCRRALFAAAALMVCGSIGLGFQPPDKDAKPPPAAAKDPAKAAEGNPAAPDDPEVGVHPSMLVDEEWKPEWGTAKEIKSKMERYRDLIRKGSLASPQQDAVLIAEVIRFKLSQLTLLKHRSPPPRPSPGLDKATKDAMEKKVREFKSQADLRREIVTDITQAGALPGSGKDARQEILKAIVKECPPLLDKHFSARLHCAILLTELNQQDTPETPFAPAIPLLVKIAADDKQHDAVRIWGVIGCKRFLMFDQTTAQNRSSILTALTRVLDAHNRESKELKLKHEWLNLRTAEALGWSDTLVVDRKPVVVEVLAQTLVDTEHPYRPRFYAAQALGRLPLDGNKINVSMLSVEIARLGSQLAEDYAKDVQKPVTRMGVFRLYYAYRPETDVDKMRGKGLRNQADKGTLAGAKNTVMESYANLLPIINAMLGSQPVPKTAMDKLTKWLADNSPKDYRIDPSDKESKPLRVNPKNDVAARPM